MRYPDNTGSSLHVTAIESQSQPQAQFPQFFHPPIHPSASLGNSPYSQEPNPYYHPPPPHIIARLGSTSTSSSSMASHAHRTTTLPHSTSMTTREQYSGDTPTFRRPSDHQSRSPSYPGTLRRAQPLSPAPSPIQSYTSPTRMDPGYGPKTGNNFPPLGAMTTIGQLEYVVEGGSVTPIKCDVNGAIDKGFFLSESEWTCYRRNYFSCTCSFLLSPAQFPGSQIQYVHEGNVYQVRGFLMSISATVADDSNQSIELVQHTPKRDKGPTSKPDKVPLAAKQPMSHQMGTSMYHPHDHTALMGPNRGLYDPTAGFSNPPQGPNNFPTEHTFERIQFKQATANNGKRRAAQQYYHLCIELWADCHNHPDQYIKVATRHSAKMIVRGRSPGHYSDNRRNSTSNGPGGSAGSLSGFPTSGMLGPDFPPSAGLAGSNFGGPYEPRGGPPPPPGLNYGPMRGSRDMPSEAYVSPEEDKSIHTTKEYQYYPGAIYEGQQDSRHGIAMFTHSTHRDDHSLMPVTMGGSYDSHSSRVKNEGEGGIGGGHGGGMALPSIFNPGPGVSSRRCQPFEGKHTSSPYYPMMPQLGLNLTNIT